VPELLPVLDVGDRRVQAPADAARRLGGGRQQKFVLGPVQGRDRLLALAEQEGRVVSKVATHSRRVRSMPQLPGYHEPRGTRFHREYRGSRVGDRRDHDNSRDVARDDIPARAAQIPPLG